MTQFQLRKAERKRAKLKIGLFGPSGSGKTMSALKLARGIAEWNKVAVIDTENGSADLYSHLGDYNVITLDAPYTPERYIEAIKACADAGMEVIIIDSITHEWGGPGGILELADELGKGAKNSFTVWNKLTPRHNKFINTILETDAHMICCGRSKQEYVMNEVEKNGKKVNVPEKIGLKAITREGFDYEMTVAFDLAISHYATTTKDRTDLFMKEPEFVIDEKTGQKLMEWNMSGAKVQPTEEQTNRFEEQMKKLGMTKEEWNEKTKLKWDELPEDVAEKWLAAHDKKISIMEEDKKTEEMLEQIDQIEKEEEEKNNQETKKEETNKNTNTDTNTKSTQEEAPKELSNGMKRAKEAMDKAKETVKKDKGMGQKQEEEVKVEDIPF